MVHPIHLQWEANDIYTAKQIDRKKEVYFEAIFGVHPKEVASVPTIKKIQKVFGDHKKAKLSFANNNIYFDLSDSDKTKTFFSSGDNSLKQLGVASVKTVDHFQEPMTSLTLSKWMDKDVMLGLYSGAVLRYDRNAEMVLEEQSVDSKYEPVLNLDYYERSTVLALRGNNKISIMDVRSPDNRWEHLVWKGQPFFHLKGKNIPDTSYHVLGGHDNQFALYDKRNLLTPVKVEQCFHASVTSLLPITSYKFLAGTGTKDGRVFLYDINRSKPVDIYSTGCQITGMALVDKDHVLITNGWSVQPRPSSKTFSLELLRLNENKLSRVALSSLSEPKRAFHLSTRDGVASYQLGRSVHVQTIRPPLATPGKSFSEFDIR